MQKRRSDLKGTLFKHWQEETALEEIFLLCMCARMCVCVAIVHFAGRSCRF